MKSWDDYLSLKEFSKAAMDVGGAALGSTSLTSDERDKLGGLFRVVELALKVARPDVVRFLSRLAKAHPEIQAEMDKMNKDELNMSALGNRLGRIGRKIKLGGESALDGNTSGDVIAPNTPDSAHGELP